MPPAPVASAKSESRPLLLKKRVLIPAAIIGFMAFASLDGEPIEDDVATAPSSTTTTEPAITTEAQPTTTTTTPTTVLPRAQSFANEVSAGELASSLSQLGEATVVIAFEGFDDYVRDSYTGGGWPDSDGDCQSDRHEILIEESLTDIQLDEDGCRVESGLWIDPYDGSEYTNADLVTIDHLIPLAAAHRAGAWEWDEQQKQEFASDISFTDTHAAVGADINQSKADRGPDEWRPPSEQGWCRYAVDWISVKDRWSLQFTQAEVSALGEMLDSCSAADQVDVFAALPTLSPLATTTTTTTVPATTSPPAPPPTTSSCHPNYSPCIPNVAGDLNCADIGIQVTVIDADPYGLDGNDNDGLGCESYG